MEQKCKVKLDIFSEVLECDEISRRIGISPTRIINKGMSRGKSPVLRYKENIWSFESDISIRQDIDQHIERLREILGIYASKIFELKPACSIQCTCVVESEDAPVLNLAPELIGFLSSMGASLDIDLYFGNNI